jgi:hypothetical protein
MRKIDKTTVLSTEYKQWEQNLEQRQESHPEYSSSDFKYYLDVVMNLFYCQQGLCAYTEMRLCPQHAVAPEYWQHGRYFANKPGFLGQLDHFDNNLKTQKAWLWNNLFLVHSDINVKIKGRKAVDSILKPDSKTYDPFRLLDYDSRTHFFIANTDLSEEEQQRITQMIDTLGLNFGPVRARRKEVLARQISIIEFGLTTWDDMPDEFVTSFVMCKQNHRVFSSP